MNEQAKNNGAEPAIVLSPAPSLSPPLSGPAFVSGVIETLYAIDRGMRSGDRGEARVFHRFEPGGAAEAAFSKGCEFASVRALGDAEFALQVRGEEPLPPVQAPESAN